MIHTLRTHGVTARSTLAVAAAAALAGCSNAYGPSGSRDDQPVATAAVSVVDNAYQPGYNAVNMGTTVTWTWNGSVGHSVTFDAAGLTDSPVQASGSFQVTFADAGTYTYYCTVHGRSVMSGRVLVRDPQQPPSTYP